jgi:heme/copper-type cytochrome/quinol oxidase subunit 2
MSLCPEPISRSGAPKGGARNPANGPRQMPEQSTRWFMPTLFVLLIVWGVLTAALIVLLIYRGTLTMHEDDQLFLGESESHMAREQVEIMTKVNKLGPFVKVLGTASAVMILGIVGLAVYQGLTQIQ